MGGCLHQCEVAGQRDHDQRHPEELELQVGQEQGSEDGRDETGQRRAAEPVLPGWVFRNRLLNATNLASLAVGVMLIGLVSYIPLYAQGVLGTSALVGGFAVAALTLGWPISASLAGRIYLRIGFRATALIGASRPFETHCFDQPRTRM